VILKLVRREFPGLPALGWNVVDVRDVACAHVDALVNSSAEGKRLACPGEFLWLVDLAKIINTLPQFSDRPLAVRSVPGFLVRLLALFDPQLKLASARLNRYEAVSDSAVVGTLGWSRRPVSTTIADTVASIFDLSLNKK
jgi:dihydroflavonol-4-reductase